MKGFLLFIFVSNFLSAQTSEIIVQVDTTFLNPTNQFRLTYKNFLNQSKTFQLNQFKQAIAIETKGLFCSIENLTFFFLPGDSIQISATNKGIVYKTRNVSFQTLIHQIAEASAEFSSKNHQSNSFNQKYDEITTFFKQQSIEIENLSTVYKLTKYETKVVRDFLIINYLSSIWNEFDKIEESQINTQFKQTEAYKKLIVTKSLFEDLSQYSTSSNLYANSVFRFCKMNFMLENAQTNAEKERIIKQNLEKESYDLASTILLFQVSENKEELVLESYFTNCKNADFKAMILEKYQQQPSIQNLFVKSKTIVMSFLGGYDRTLPEILKSNRGKTILVVFWSSLYPECINELKKISDIKESNPDLKVLIINVLDTPKERLKVYNQERLDQLRATNFYIANLEQSDILATIIGNSLPRYCLFDKNGTLISRDLSQLDATVLKKIMSGK